jgi:hypothetical protein
VTDRVGDVLPDLGSVVDERGDVHALRVLGRIARNPSDVAAWMGLARGARAARRGLVPAVAAALADAA